MKWDFPFNYVSNCLSPLVLCSTSFLQRYKSPIERTSIRQPLLTILTAVNKHLSIKIFPLAVMPPRHHTTNLLSSLTGTSANNNIIQTSNGANNIIFPCPWKSICIFPSQVDAELQFLDFAIFNASSCQLAANTREDYLTFRISIWVRSYGWDSDDLVRSSAF